MTFRRRPPLAFRSPGLSQTSAVLHVCVAAIAALAWTTQMPPSKDTALDTESVDLIGGATGEDRDGPSVNDMHMPACRR